jgi:cytidylate kinase
MSAIPHRWVGPQLDARVAAHVHVWTEARKNGVRLPETLPFVTISREFGCEAYPLAVKLAELINHRLSPTVPWMTYDQELLDRVAAELHLHREIVESIDNRRRSEMTELFNSIINVKLDESLVYRKLAEVIRSLAIHGHTILIGRGSYLITQDLKTGLHVRLVAPRRHRVHTYADTHQLPLADAERLVIQGEKERERYLQTVWCHDPTQTHYHDLTFDVSRFNLQQMAEIISVALWQRFEE